MVHQNSALVNKIFAAGISRSLQPLSSDEKGLPLSFIVWSASHIGASPATTTRDLAEKEPSSHRRIETRTLRVPLPRLHDHWFAGGQRVRHPTGFQNFSVLPN